MSHHLTTCTSCLVDLAQLYQLLVPICCSNHWVLLGSGLIFIAIHYCRNSILIVIRFFLMTSLMHQFHMVAAMELGILILIFNESLVSLCQLSHHYKLSSKSFLPSCSKSSLFKVNTRLMLHTIVQNHLVHVGSSTSSKQH